MLPPERHVESRSRKQGMQEQAGVMGAASNHLGRMLKTSFSWGGPEQRPRRLALCLGSLDQILLEGRFPSFHSFPGRACSS